MEAASEATLRQAWLGNLLREYGPRQASGPSGPFPLVGSANGVGMERDKYDVPQVTWNYSQLGVAQFAA
mgnify:CR=1 FL=1